MDEMKSAVVFAILMENNDGILGKAPSYVMEKWEAVKCMDEPERLLDTPNFAKFLEWRIKWCGGK